MMFLQSNRRLEYTWLTAFGKNLQVGDMRPEVFESMILIINLLVRRRGAKAKKEFAFLHFLPLTNIYFIYYFRYCGLDFCLLIGWSDHAIALDRDVDIDERHQNECQHYSRQDYPIYHLRLSCGLRDIVLNTILYPFWR